MSLGARDEGHRINHYETHKQKYKQNVKNHLYVLKSSLYASIERAQMGSHKFDRMQQTTNDSRNHTFKASSNKSLPASNQ